MDSSHLKQYFTEHHKCIKHIGQHIETIPKASTTVLDFDKLEGPFVLSILPTDFCLKPALNHLQSAVTHVTELFLGGTYHPRNLPVSIRPVLNHLELLVSLSVLHGQTACVDQSLKVLQQVARDSRRLHDERFAVAWAILLSLEQNNIPAARRLINKHSIEPLDGCPDARGFVCQLATIVYNAYTDMSEYQYTKLQVLGTTHENYFASKTLDSVYCRALLLLWQIRIRLQLGDPGLVGECTLLTAVLKLYSLVYSMIKFVFGVALQSSHTACSESGVDENPMFSGKESTLTNGWNAVNMLMDTMYLITYIYTFVGVNRESRCFLREFIKFSQRFYLPHRVRQCLRLMVHVERVSENPSKASLRLKQIEHTLKSIHPLPQLPTVVTSCDPEDEEDDMFIHSTLITQSKPSATASGDIPSSQGPRDDDDQEVSDSLVAKATGLQSIALQEDRKAGSPIHSKSKEAITKPSNEITQQDHQLTYLYNRENSPQIWFQLARDTINDLVLGGQHHFSILATIPPSPINLTTDCSPLISTPQSAGVVDELAVICSQLKTPPRSSRFLVPKAPHKETEDDIMPLSTTVNNKQRTAVAKKASRTEYLPDSDRKENENLAELCSQLSNLKKPRHKAKAGLTEVSLLVETKDIGRAKTNKKTTSVLAPRKIKEGRILTDSASINLPDEDDEIELCPTAPYVSANVRQITRQANKRAQMRLYSEHLKSSSVRESGSSRLRSTSKTISTTKKVPVGSGEEGAESEDVEMMRADPDTDESPRESEVMRFTHSSSKIEEDCVTDQRRDSILIGTNITNVSSHYSDSSCVETSLRALSLDQRPVDSDLLSRLTDAYRTLRWLPPAQLMRPLCHLLSLLALQSEDQIRAAFYLSQAVAIAFRYTYETELITQSNNKEKGTRYATALEVYRSSLRDIPSWRRSLLALPSDWLLLQFTLVDELSLIGEPTLTNRHRSGGHRMEKGTGDACCYLLVTRIRQGQDPETKVMHRFTNYGSHLLDLLDQIMVENIQSTSVSQRSTWWRIRYGLDDRMQELLERMKTEWFSEADLAWIMKDQRSTSTTVLHLDRRLNNVPVEWLLSADDTASFCRMSCLPVTLSHLSLVHHRVERGLSIPRQGYYVVNPDRNLNNTEDRLMPLLTDPGLAWKGVMGRQPTQEEMLDGLTNYSIFTFCGHGNGSKYLVVDTLLSANSKAVVLLFGCSSGRLRIEGQYEPTSSILSHLLAGSPCVLGLLWDVTDADIDRFSLHLLSDWRHASPSNDQSRFTHLMRRARTACKMKHLVGKSPVIYGFPVDKIADLQQ